MPNTGGLQSQPQGTERGMNAGGAREPRQPAWRGIQNLMPEETAVWEDVVSVAGGPGDKARQGGRSWFNRLVIKSSVSNMAKFENRLREIAVSYFSRRPPGMVMWIVASDAAPGKKSDICTRGKRFPAHQFTHPKWCPILILFSRVGGVFRPHFPAIEAMVANLGRVVETVGVRSSDPTVRPGV